MFCNDFKVSKQKQKILEKFEGKKNLTKVCQRKIAFLCLLHKGIFCQHNGVPMVYINKQ